MIAYLTSLTAAFFELSAFFLPQCWHSAVLLYLFVIQVV